MLPKTYKDVLGEETVARPGTAAGPASLPPIEDQRFALYKSTAGYRAIMNWYDEALATIECPFESRYVATRFGQTHMLVAGPPDGEPLLLIPGVAGCAPLWRRQLPAFAEHFRVYALDIVGQPGRSYPTPLSFDNDDYSNWLLDVLDGLGLKRAHLAGTSVGGWVALRFAIDAPERVNKIVMLSPTGISRAKFPLKIMLTRVFNRRKDANALENELTAKSVAKGGHGGSFGTFDRQLARLMALCTRHYRVDRSIDIYKQDTGKVSPYKALRVLRTLFWSEPRNVLRRFKAPALLILGEHEILYKPEQVVRRARKLMPHIRTDVIAGAGHAAIYDKPEAVNQRVVDYLRADHQTRNRQ